MPQRRRKMYVMEPATTWICTTCHGTGTTDNGTLDPDRLAVLSDALREAGLPEWERCEKCSGRGFLGGTAPGHPGWIGAPDCPDCKSACVVSNTLLAHLRSGGPHWRGCWVIDCVLGKV